MRRIVVILFACILAQAETIPADSARGARVFETQHCIECHSVNGKGGRTAPDLGRHIDRNFTPAMLASTMWNHAPTMWSAMRARNLESITLDDQSAADLFAYFYSARFFEKPGDAGRGKRLFEERSCARCHGIAEAKISGARPVSQWQSLGDPIALTTAMWNHAGSMSAELSRQGIRWQELNGQQLTDLLVYLRNLGPTKELTSSFQTTAGTGGKDLFTQKGCVQCHSVDTASMQNLKEKSLTDIAAQMWDHGLQRPAATVPLQPGEMRELLSYVWAGQFFQSSGDAGKGKRVFAAKHCAGCHDNASSGAPSLSQSNAVSGITIVSALWHHGPAMLAMMTKEKIRWPRFDAAEMSDMIAYLNTRTEKQDAKQDANRGKAKE